MDLAGAILLIDATVRSLRNSRTEAKYCEIVKDCEHLSEVIDTGYRRSKRARSQSSRLKDMVVLEATGDCNSADPDIAIYYEVIDRFLGELDAGECSDILSAIVA